MRFEILNHGSCVNIGKVIGQFRDFQNEECKLPCFFMHIYDADSEISSKLTVNKKVDEYVFYEKSSNGYWVSFGSSFVNLSEDLKTISIYLANTVRADGFFECNYLTMIAYKYILISNNAFMFHSAAVAYEDEGILFCGNSGAGKSTQANMWEKYLKAKPLNYDKPCVLKEGDNYIVHGSPWSGKECLKLNDRKPIKAVVFVKQSKENRAYRLSPAQAFSYMYLNNYVFPLSEEFERKYISVIKDAAENIPVYILECDMSENAVKVLYEEIFEKEYKSLLR